MVNTISSAINIIIRVTLYTEAKGLGSGWFGGNWFVSISEYDCSVDCSRWIVFGSKETVSARAMDTAETSCDFLDCAEGGGCDCV